MLCFTNPTTSVRIPPDAAPVRHCLLDHRGFVETAARRHHGAGESLQEAAAQGATERAHEGVTERTKIMLLGGGRGRKPTEDPGDDLDYEVGNRPRHFANPLSMIPKS
jgi:hypothetical protein